MRVRLDELPQRLLQRKHVPGRQHAIGLRLGRRHLRQLPGQRGMREWQLPKLQSRHLPGRLLLRGHVHHQFEPHSVRHERSHLHLVQPHLRRQLHEWKVPLRQRTAVQRRSALHRWHVRVRCPKLLERLLQRQRLRSRSLPPLRHRRQCLHRVRHHPERPVRQRPLQLRHRRRRPVWNGPAVRQRQLRVRCDELPQWLLRQRAVPNQLATLLLDEREHLLQMQHDSFRPLLQRRLLLRYERESVPYLRQVRQRPMPIEHSMTPHAAGVRCCDRP